MRALLHFGVVLSFRKGVRNRRRYSFSFALQRRASTSSSEWLSSVSDFIPSRSSRLSGDVSCAERRQSAARALIKSRNANEARSWTFCNANPLCVARMCMFYIKNKYIQNCVREQTYLAHMSLMFMFRVSSRNDSRARRLQIAPRKVNQKAMCYRKVSKNVRGDLLT